MMPLSVSLLLCRGNLMKIFIKFRIIEISFMWQAPGDAYICRCTVMLLYLGIHFSGSICLISLIITMSVHLSAFVTKIVIHKKLFFSILSICIEIVSISRYSMELSISKIFTNSIGLLHNNSQHMIYFSVISERPVSHSRDISDHFNVFLQQAITWTSVFTDLCHHIAPLMR